MPWKENATYVTPDGYETHWFPDNDAINTRPWLDVDGNLVTERRINVLAQRMADLYVSYRQKWNKGQNGKTWLVKKAGECVPLQQKHLIAHLSRRYSVHVFCGMGSKFVCFDVDRNDWQLVQKVIGAIADFGIPRDYVYVSTSGNKGYHVEVFFDQMVYVTDLFVFYCHTVGRFEGVEFRPTNRQSIKLPLSKHSKTGNICWYLDRDTGNPILSADYLFEIKQFSREEFTELLAHCHVELPLRELSKRIEAKTAVDYTKVDYTKGNDIQFSALPDWVPMLTEPGARHNTMLHIACEANHRHFNYDATLRLLTLWAEKQNPNYYSSSLNEILYDAELICNWVYRAAGDEWPKDERSGDEWSKDEGSGDGEVGGGHRAQTWLPSLSIDLNDEDAMAEQRRNPKYCFDAASAARVLSIHSQNVRKIYFLILCEHIATNVKSKGYYKATAERIGEIVEMARPTVASRITKMIENGYIWSPPPKRYQGRDGKPRANSRIYKASDLPIKYPDWEQHATGNTYTGRIADLESNFVTEYYRAMFTVLQRDYAISHLTKWERDELGRLGGESVETQAAVA